MEPSRKTGTQPGRTFLDSSCETASDELEKSISSESESLAIQLDGRREAEGGEHLDGAEGTTNEKKKVFSTSLMSLKHFDCEEKQELIERAKENYSREI
ncbi:hypothetical protein EK904_005644 [Melospiza melodia maxima]|nr:hypothetical protein EK904_005644 [Melospiza melodia maxima]